MVKYQNFAILASFFGLWVNSYLSTQAEIWLGFILIFTFGILHGANDLELIKNVNSKDKTVSKFKILLYYISIVVAGAVLFYIIPWLALTLFILVSGFHFGEQQWNEKLKTESEWIKLVFQVLYGLLILFLIFTFHTLEVQKIIFTITNSTPISSIKIIKSYFNYMIFFTFII